ATASCVSSWLSCGSGVAAACFVRGYLPAHLASSDRRQATQLEDGPNLDGPLRRSRNAPGDVDRFVEVRSIDQEETAELFAGLGEGAVRHLAFACANTDAGGGRNRMQRGSAQVFPLSVEFMRQRSGLRNAVLAFGFGPDFLVGVDKQYVLHRFLLQK